MEREACVCDHGFERSDLCAEIIIIIILYGEHDIHKQLPNNRLCSLFFFLLWRCHFFRVFLVPCTVAIFSLYGDESTLVRFFLFRKNLIASI